MLFTDIQASTTLWGEIPEQMSEALDVHHAVIRKLIKKYKCYEVKTVGDCFMVATADPCNAVRLALGIQDALYDYDWPDDAIDEVLCMCKTGLSFRHETYLFVKGLRLGSVALNRQRPVVDQRQFVVNRSRLAGNDGWWSVGALLMSRGTECRNFSPWH